jgi:hypothetical protein
MNVTRSVRWIFGAAIAAFLVGCGGGGDIKINADDNSTVNNPPGGGGGSTNPCASYVDPSSMTTVQGSFDGTNCTYSTSFVSETNPLTVDLTIPFISGVHIFQGTLAVGENVDGTDPSIIPPAGGDGPILTIEAGNTLVWSDATDYLLINRGSQIIADGSAGAPITFTGFLDAVTGTADPEAVQLWGGVVINGNGITNKCSDAQRASNSCNVLSEGKPSNYGGNDNADSSGILRYVVVKHTGFEVVTGDELNGVTFNTVGSGTVVENLETYSTFDDGIEFFGGAVNVENFVALYVRDDSIDYADGWVGSVNKALVIHSGRNRANRCIEADNQGTDFTAQPLTNPTITNMTCILSNIDNDIGDSEGVLLRRGVASQLQDSIIYDGYGVAKGRNGNECFEADDTQTLDLMQDTTTTMASVMDVCEEPIQSGQEPLPNGDTVQQWVLDTGTNGTYPANTNNVLQSDSTLSTDVLGGSTCYYSSELLNASDDIIGSFYVDPMGTQVDVPSVNGSIVGAASESTDWTQNWTFGLSDLWFVNPDGTCATP